MSREGRLYDVVQALRRARAPVTAAKLADDLGVTSRTLYRDIATLVARGVPIRGEAGVGYVLEPGHFLPPLTFGADELDALLLGLAWVEERADPAIARAAVDARARLEAVLPSAARAAAETPGVFVRIDRAVPNQTIPTTLFRNAVRDALTLDITYCDGNGIATDRTIWPIGLAFMEHGRAVMAWCTLRAAFRTFHLDRVIAAEPGAPYPERRAVLIQRCRAQIAAELQHADTRCQGGMV